MKIVIVGTGTASWISAFVLSHTTDNEIFIIENTDIGIIGVGEGSTNIFIDLINGKHFKSKVHINDFIKALDCTPKLAIHFKDWTAKKGYDYYSPIDGTRTAFNFKDKLFIYALKTFKEKYHLASKCGYAVENNKMEGGAFHFDTTKVGSFFKPFCEDKGVKVINAFIDSVELDENGNIKNLLTKSKEKISGDFFIDATGFHKALFKHLDYKWIDYKNNLPMNKAIPFHIRYENMTKEEFYKVKAVTTAQAMNAGWQWKIPTTRRLGCGYVFSDDFISDADAMKELDIFYNGKVDILKTIPFRSGRLENQWIKNVLAIGLTGAFAEPLQATSIHTTITQIIRFSQSYCKNNIQITLDDKMRDKFNLEMSRLYDDMRDFLVLHYTGDRDDTNFWKFIKTKEHITPLVKNMIEYSKHSIPDFNTMPVYYGHVNHQLWNWTLAGLGYLTPELAEKETKLYNLDDEDLLFNHIKYLDEQTKNSLSFQDFIMGNNEEAKNKFKNGN
jgi:tryptophan halogenase